MESVINTFDQNIEKLNALESDTKERMARLSKELSSTTKFDSVIKVQESCELAERQISSKLTSQSSSDASILPPVNKCVDGLGVFSVTDEFKLEMPRLFSSPSKGTWDGSTSRTQTKFKTSAMLLQHVLN